MAMFDSIIAEADERFNLDGKAGTLLSALLALMTDGDGLAGFLEKFNQADLNGAASSWVGAGANEEISNEQIESALGKNTIENFASQAGIEYEKASSSIAFMTPRIIDALTPDAILPESGDLISRIGGFLNGADETVSEKKVAQTFDRVGTAAAPLLHEEKTEPVDANEVKEAKVFDRVDAASETSLSNENYEKSGDSALKWILPLLLLGLLLVTGYWFCSRTVTSPTVPNTNANQVNLNAANQ